MEKTKIRKLDDKAYQEYISEMLSGEEVEISQNQSDK